MRVLMIEDNEDDFLLVQYQIAKISDIQIEWRNSVDQGLAYLGAQSVDLLLLDLSLPDGQGLAILNRVQSRYARLPIIILSGDDNEALALEAIQHGAQDYLVKGRIDGVGLGRSLRYAIERKQLEERLHQSEAQFRSSFNYASVGMALVSLDGKWLQVNHALCGIIGYTEAELLTTTFQDITHPDDLSTDLGYVRQLLAGEIETYQMEKRYFHKQGHEVWVLLSVSLVRDSQNQPLHFISQIQDITQRKQAEAALAAERNLLRTLIDSIPDYIYVKDRQSRFVIANKAVLLGGGMTRPEQIIGKTDFDFFPPEIAQAFYEDEVEVFASGQGLIDREEVSVDLKTGDELWFSTSKVPLRDEHGTVTGLLGVSWDITSRKRMEAALIARIEAEHELQNYLKMLHEITIELTNIEDLDEFYKRAVSFGLQRLGFDRLGLLLYDEAASLAIGTYGTDAEGKLVAEHHLRFDPSALTSILRRALQQEEHFAVDEEAELFNEFKPIGMGWNAAAVLWNGTEKLGWLAMDNGVQHLPMRQAQLSVLALYALTLGSLLAQKRTQIAVQESERHLRLLAQNSPDVIYIMDLTKQRATYLNRAEFLGYSQSEIEGSGSLLNALHPDDQAQVMAHWQEAISGKRDTGGMIEYRLQDKAGQWQWIQSRETIFASSSEAKPTQILVTLTEITERKLAEQRLLELTNERERVQLLSDFVRDISHDFRTPLAVISTSLYILSKTSDPDKQKKALDKAQGQISRLTQLIERLLIMARLDSESAFALQATDLNRLIAIFCTSLTFDGKGKGIRVVDALAEGSLMIAGNAKELTLALGELGKNALGFTPAEGTITIRTRRQDNQAVIEVADSGIGIPADEFIQIFQRLYRVDQARSFELGGSGLGLSIAKRIVELHRGSIEVESVVGQGSTFRVILPLSE
ncbi:MAG: PAS domain S-box protein [Chloroflexota bacterium]